MITNDYTVLVPMDEQDTKEIARIKSELREKHLDDWEKAIRYRQMYKEMIKANAVRTSRFVPSDEFTYEAFSYKEAKLELLKPKKPSKRIILMFRGCAYINNLADSHARYTELYAKAFEYCNVLIVDHKVAPEYIYEDTINDMVYAYQWIIAQGFQPENIIFIGDSSGGGTAITTTMMLQDLKFQLPKCLILISPWANINLDTNSYEMNGNRDCIMGDNRFLQHAAKLFTQANADEELINWPFHREYHDLPKMLVLVGTDDIVYDDSITIAENAFQAKIHVRLEIYDQMYHDFPFDINLTNTAKKAWESMLRFIQ